MNLNTIQKNISLQKSFYNVSLKTNMDHNDKVVIINKIQYDFSRLKKSKKERKVMNEIGTKINNP